MTVSDPAACVQRELWGGAVTCTVPARLLDVSDMRPVPDHQEVYADAEADQALIFEIVEHDAAVPDEECGRHIFQDAATGNEAASASLESVTSLGPQDAPHVQAGAYKCLVRGRQTVRRGRVPTDTDVLLAVLRLPQVQSDLVISLSTPVSTAEAAAARTEAPGIMAQALGTLRVVDWDLFGGGEH
ncbi:multicopy suppressor of ts gsp1 [Pleodorina starrii]|uniref:Multicopy suppressor of ts gsp1 n=1 Tax=Pleodorina starrii TaxID=330485 RepID=A0A9W6C0U5_9CHLO|nr:multicopy suppressor of ts gsp1 [Pleodorina starrii]GLC75856.1 multicopy suppressor of ts gsp1 [Pleodorina starrii]